MLRYYDKIELLKPSYIEQNGYRYYSEEELHKVCVIKQLRRYEFSLEEIDKIISKNDAEYTKNMFRLKIDYLQKSAIEHSYLIIEMEKQIRALTDKDNILYANKNFDILIGYRREFLALCKRKRTNEEEIEKIIDELYEVINNSKDLVSIGPTMAVFYQAHDVYDPDDIDIEVCIPVNIDFNEGAYYTRIIEGALYISTIVIGRYDILGNAYATLLKWAKQNNYSIIGPSIERYYKDCKETYIQDEYITELCIPVKHN